MTGKNLIPAILLIAITVTLPFTSSASINRDTMVFASSRVFAHRPVASTIKVYFVSGMFSVEQRKVLWTTMQDWQGLRKAGSEISFIDSGESSGLIDCEGCLTVVRQDRFTKRRSSFNPLRLDGIGRLASAWIGLDRSTTKSHDLRDLMRVALETGLGR